MIFKLNKTEDALPRLHYIGKNLQGATLYHQHRSPAPTPSLLTLPSYLLISLHLTIACTKIASSPSCAAIPRHNKQRYQHLKVNVNVPRVRSESECPPHAFLQETAPAPPASMKDKEELSVKKVVV
jgi:hypothetical protein